MFDGLSDMEYRSKLKFITKLRNGQQKIKDRSKDYLSWDEENWSIWNILYVWRSMSFDGWKWAWFWVTKMFNKVSWVPTKVLMNGERQLLSLSAWRRYLEVYRLSRRQTRSHRIHSGRVYKEKCLWQESNYLASQFGKNESSLWWEILHVFFIDLKKAW